MSEEEVMTYIRDKFANLRTWAETRFGVDKCKQHNEDINKLLSDYKTLVVVTDDIFRKALEQGKLIQLIKTKFADEAAIALSDDDAAHIARYFHMLCDIL